MVKEKERMPSLWKKVFLIIYKCQVRENQLKTKNNNLPNDKEIGDLIERIIYVLN